MNDKYLQYMHKRMYPKGLHRLLKEWVHVEELRCSVCDMYGESSNFKCICEDKKRRQKKLEKEIVSILHKKNK